MKVKDEVLIKKCVSTLYRAISCDSTKEPDYDKIRDLFVENAIIAEYEGKDSKTPNIKTIDDHIQEIKDIFKKYPFILNNGFYENELASNIMINGPTATVYSEYEKKYYNGTKDIKNIGCNIMQLIRVDDDYKILSVSWYEQ